MHKWKPWLVSLQTSQRKKNTQDGRSLIVIVAIRGRFKDLVSKGCKPFLGPSLLFLGRFKGLGWQSEWWCLWALIWPCENQYRSKLQRRKTHRVRVFSFSNAACQYSLSLRHWVMKSRGSNTPQHLLVRKCTSDSSSTRMTLADFSSGTTSPPWLWDGRVSKWGKNDL